MSKKLNETQLIAAHLLGAGHKPKDIAKKLNVREETLSRWRGQSLFDKVVIAANNDLIDTIIDRQKALLSLAQDTIEETLHTKALDPYRKSMIALKYLQICKEKELFKIGILKNFYRSSV